MKLKYLTQNSKLKKTSKATGLRVFNFGITAQDSCIGATTCKKYCYASKGAYIWSNVAKVFKWRFDQTRKDCFIEDMFEDIVNAQASHIRIHDSGDFYSKEYLDKWLYIIESLPHVQFYAYTKSIPLFLGRTLPDNFTVIYSLGGRWDNLIDTKEHRHAAIFKDLNSIPKNYVNASDNDLNAITNNKNVALVAH